MRVLIHALGADMGGSLRHLTGFLPALAASNFSSNEKIEYTVFIRDSLKLPDQSPLFNFERISRRFSEHFILRVLFDNLYIPYYLRKNKIDILVSLTNFGPLWGVKRHIVYQRNPIYFSHWFAKKLGPKGALEHYLRAFYVYFLMKSSTVTVVPSDAMKTMILDYFQELSQLRFKTIYHAFDFAHYQTEADPTLTAKLPLGVPVFLYPTHIAMHKGMDILLKGLAEFKEIYGPKFCCVITAFLDEWSQGKAELIDLIRKNKIEENVIFIGKVSQRQMGYLYQKATAMVYPSVLESFGFSMIEALNFKLPIVASDTLVNREICRNGALYYPVFEPRLLALALQKLLNDETRKELVNGGIEALKRRDWGWSAYVEEFVKLLMDVNVSS